MDAFNVPKKVNRHVLKALNILSRGNVKKRIPTAEILNQVKYQMRNLVPVRNINMAVQNSLKNLSHIGLIERLGPAKFAIGRRYAPPSQQANDNSTERRLFTAKDQRKINQSTLDPNKNRAYHSEESLSGDEYDRSRKRLRTNNKKFKYAGRSTELPKARQHYDYFHHHHRPQTTHALDNYLSIPGVSGMDYNFADIFVGTNLMGCESERSLNMEFNMGNVAPPLPLVIAEMGNDMSNTIGNLQTNDSTANKNSQENVIELYRKRSTTNDKIISSEQSICDSLTQSQCVAAAANNSAKQSTESLKTM